MSVIKNDRNQLINRTIDNYKTALTSYQLATDAIKHWTPETDSITFGHVQKCHSSIFAGVECALKLYFSITIDEHYSLAHLCKKAIGNSNLNKVDLCCFVTCKEPRNQTEHNSLIVELKDYQRVLKNFYLLLIACFQENEISQPPDALSTVFDFDQFYHCMNGFTEEYCRYVLICNPLHDSIPGEGSIDWNAVKAALDDVGYHGVRLLEVESNTARPSETPELFLSRA